MSNEVTKSIILFSLHVITKTMKFQNALFLLLFASLYLKKKSLLEVKMCKVMFVRTWKYNWRTSFSFVHMLEFKRIIVERVKHFFCTDFLVNESSSYEDALICFWTFQMKKTTILAEVRVLYLVAISAEKEKATTQTAHVKYFAHATTIIHRIHCTRVILHRNDQKHKRTHTNTQTLSRPTVRRRENKRSSAPTSIHPTQEGHWQLSIYFTANMHTHTQRTCNSRVTRTSLCVAGCACVDLCWITDQED